jgi:hypothetical protein
MPSKQFASLQELSLQRLQSRIPSDCPLMVSRDPAVGFRAWTMDGVDEAHGRFQVVHAFIDGYVACWRRVRPSVDAVSRTRL